MTLTAPTAMSAFVWYACRKATLLLLRRRLWLGIFSYLGCWELISSPYDWTLPWLDSDRLRLIEHACWCRVENVLVVCRAVVESSYAQPHNHQIILGLALTHSISMAIYLRDERETAFFVLLHCCRCELVEAKEPTLALGDCIRVSHLHDGGRILAMMTFNSSSLLLLDGAHGR